jgi:hypothetical protein
MLTQPVEISPKMETPVRVLQLKRVLPRRFGVVGWECCGILTTITMMTMSPAVRTAVREARTHTHTDDVLRTLRVAMPMEVVSMLLLLPTSQRATKTMPVRWLPPDERKSGGEKGENGEQND